MAAYLVEDEVGFAVDVVGFPSLGGCMAFVLQVRAGLFGFHIPPGHKDRIAGFDAYCRAHPSYGAMKHLYGSCYWDNRYDGASNKFLAWLDEMRYLAATLGYAGPMSGFNTSATQTGIGRTDATYLEYRRVADNGTCTVHYMNMVRVTPTRTEDLATDVRRLMPDGGGVVPYLSKVVTSVAVTGGALTDVTDKFGFYTVG